MNKTYQYFPVVYNIEQTKCAFCNQREDFRRFRNGRVNLRSGDLLYIKMCPKCFFKAKHNRVFCRKVVREVKDYLGIN